MLVLTKEIKQEITDFCGSKPQKWYFENLQKKLNSINANSSKDIEKAVLLLIEDDEKTPVRCGFYHPFLKRLLEFVKANLTNNQ